MWRSLVWVVSAVSLVGAAGLAGAADVAVGLRAGAAHHRALGWVGVLMAVSFVGGAVHSLMAGRMRVGHPGRIRVELTSADNPGTFFLEVASFVVYGLIAVGFAVYQFGRA